MITYPLGVGNCTTRVHESGSGDKHLVLLHGVAARADRWRVNLDGLATAGYHVYALDFPGHGLATKGPGLDYSVPGYARFVEDFMDVLGIDRCALIGTSLGGHVAGMVALDRPAQIDALILVGAVGITPLGDERRTALGTRLRDTSIEGTAQKLRRVIHDDQALVTDEWILEEHLVNTSPGAAEAFASVGDYICERLDIDAVGEALTSLREAIPTLLIWGAEDVGIPVSVGEAAQACLGVPLVLMADAAHAPYFERPEVFNRIVVAFLRGEGEAELDGVTYRSAPAPRPG